MSTAKRSGARDISELKARLGLKKKSPKGGAPAGASGAVPPPAGVVPPPGARVPGAVPVPPGVAPPQPQIPDASEDPFGAMNAMAAHGAARTAAPAVVVVNDGSPVESVERKTMAIRLAKLGGIVLVPLILGSIIGRVGSNASEHNASIEQAKKLAADIETVGKRLITLQQILQVAKERGQKDGKPWYKLNDAKLTQELKALEPLHPNMKLLEDTYLNQFPKKFVEQLLPFYAETAKLQKDLREHVKLSLADQNIIKEGQTKLGSFNPRAYAGLFVKPTADEAQQGKPVMFKLVQLGMPICEENGKPNPKGCGAMPHGFQYRVSETGQWGTQKVNGSSFEGDGLVLFNPDTPFFKGILKGGGASVAEAAYMDRLSRIDKQVEQLVGVRKYLLQILNNKKNQSTHFTFFM